MSDELADLNSGKVLSVLAILVALQAWSLTVSYDALETSQEALIAAKTARPNPYTSLDASEDHKLHMELHRQQSLTYTQMLDTNIALLDAQLTRRIEGLPRPPKEVADLLRDMDVRLNKIETILDAHLTQLKGL